MHVVLVAAEPARPTHVCLVAPPPTSFTELYARLRAAERLNQMQRGWWNGDVRARGDGVARAAAPAPAPSRRVAG